MEEKITAQGGGRGDHNPMKVSVSVGAAPPDVGDIRGKYGPRCLACGRKIPVGRCALQNEPVRLR